MEVAGQVALISGANRGIGRQFLLEMLDRGFSKIYACVRRPEEFDLNDPRVLPIRLDLLDADSITAAARIATDVTILENNVCISTGASLVTGSLDDLRLEMTRISGAI